MRIFTKSLLTLALMAFGATSAFAGVIEEDLTLDMYKKYNTWGAEAVATEQASGAELNLNTTLEGGNVVCGTGGVFGTVFVDLTGYTKIRFTGAPDDPAGSLTLRVMFNRDGDGSGALIEKNPVITAANPTVEIDLTEISQEFVHLVTVKINWGGKGQITGIELVKPADPLEVPKKNLNKAINSAKTVNSLFKNPKSYAGLLQAIADAEAALVDPSATEESLTAAMDNVTAASNVSLAKGYKAVLPSMFLKYESVEEPGEGTVPQYFNCAYDLNKVSDMPYGDGNVSETMWLDLTDMEQLVVVTKGDIKPRFCMNRLVAGGQQAATQEESKMLDINDNAGNSWSADKYETISEIEGGFIYTIDVKAIVEDYGFARLHSIKKQGWGAGVYVTDMMMYRTPAASDASTYLAKASLESALAKVDLVDLTKLTRESYAPLKAAIDRAQELLNETTPSVVALNETRDAITEGLANAEERVMPEEGFYDLTTDMFLEWDGITMAALPTENIPECAYAVGVEKGASAVIYGSSSATPDALTYADLTDYDKFVIVATPGMQFRLLFNRAEVGSGVNEIKPTIDETGVYVLDLAEVGAPVRLNAIRLARTTATGTVRLMGLVKGDYDLTTVGISNVNARAERDVIFNLAGQRLAKPQKGINIINGKKVSVD